MWGNDSFGGGGGGGGGFVAGGSQINSPAGQGERTSKARRGQNIIPLTCRQALECEGDTYKIQDVEANVVTIVGLVKSVETSTTKISFHIDDQTGTIEAVQYVGTDGETSSDAHTILVEGTYGRIIGGLRSMKGSKYIIIYKVFPIIDMNEVTCHALEVLQVPMKLKKLREIENSKGVGEASGGLNKSNSLTNSMLGSEYSGNTSTSGGEVSENIKGFNSQQKTVFLVIKKMSDSESGMHKDQIIENLKGKMNPKDIMNVMEFLSGEGHVYSTIDDDHYKVTDW